MVKTKGRRWFDGCLPEHRQEFAQQNSHHLPSKKVRFATLEDYRLRATMGGRCAVTSLPTADSGIPPMAAKYAGTKKGEENYGCDGDFIV